MSEMEEKTAEALQPLIGLRLCLAKTSGDLRAFHFGEARRDVHTFMGDYALHLSCPWRLQSRDKIVTGSADHYERAEHNNDPAWEPGMVWGTYQEKALRQVLGCPDSEPDVCVNSTPLLVVESVRSDPFGGAEISLSGGYQLVIFPSGARGEKWRLLPPGEAHHFVVSG